MAAAWLHGDTGGAASSAAHEPLPQPAPLGAYAAAAMQEHTDEWMTRDRKRALRTEGELREGQKPALRRKWPQYGKLDPEEIVHEDYVQCFTYWNIDDDCWGRLRLLWRWREDEQCEFLTTCSYIDLEEDQITEKGDWSPWHGRFQIASVAGDMGLRIFFDFAGRDAVREYHSKFTLVFPSAEFMWTFAGRDYRDREIRMCRWGPIQCWGLYNGGREVDYLHVPLPDTTGGRPR